MADREKILETLNHCCFSSQKCDSCPDKDCAKRIVWIPVPLKLMLDIKELLKEQGSLTQKMWNALYAEEDKLEKQYVGTDDHDGWFFVFRPWLQRGFEIALKVLTDQDGR